MYVSVHAVWGKLCQPIDGAPMRGKIGTVSRAASSMLSSWSRINI